MTNRTVRIASIIKQRRPLADKIAAVEANLQSLVTTLDQLEAQRQQLLLRVDDDRVIGNLQEVDCYTIQRRLAAELLALSQLRSRFSRDTLNIGVIGRARQGKSRLLQSLTGLTTAEIPDGDRQHCTGVRSTIHHNANLETYGEVWFHSPQSFLDQVIAPYYEKLHLGAKPPTLAAFASYPLPQLPASLSGYAEPGAMYQHLKRYHANFDKYHQLLTSASPHRITQAEIRQYVAQDTPDGQRVYFNYLAVQEVKITCKFPDREVGQIALVDMPGLGDTGVGDAERLVQTLGKDVDAVLLVRMPKSTGDYWADVDVRLYDIARDALVDLPINLWSFLVLNRTDANSKNGDNWQNCQDLAANITEQQLNVVETVIANCADSQAAHQVLDSILNYLADQIVFLDQKYATACQERLLQLHSTVNAELDKARRSLNQATARDNWFPLFVQLFDRLWDDLTSGLESLLQSLREQRDLQDLDFKFQVETALQACREDAGIPTVEQIETRRNRVGGYPNAYYEYLNEVRSHLSQHFLLLDAGLKQGLERVKSQVTEVLVKSGSLGKLTEVRGAKFLSAIATQLPEQLISGQPSKLKLGFEIIADFDLSYRGLIQHRIRQHLDDLTPDETSLQLSASPTASEVSTCLQALQAEAVYKCGSALDDLLAEPNQAAFAIVEEFLDRILRAEGVKTEWRIFLEEVRSEVWSDEFEQLGDRTRTRREWLDAVERVAAANELSAMNFLERSH